MRFKRLDLFQIGLLFVPFDNLFFAPSRGWATIAPLIFGMYVILNFRSFEKGLGKECNLLMFLGLLLFYETIILMFNGLQVDLFIDSLMTFILGLVFYLAVVMRYQIHRKNINRDGQVLYHAYIISFIYGIIRLIGLELVPELLNIFYVLEKRSYDRLAFSFTEPSFISVHIFGVLFLFSYLISDDKLAKKMLRLGVLFLLTSIMTMSSTRSIVDVLVFIALMIMSNMINNKKYIVRNMLFLCGGISLIPVMISLSPRFQQILSRGINFDASGASRWFRIDAFLAGCFKHPLQAFWGSGFGNLSILFREGINEAYRSFSNAYTAEVDGLMVSDNISTLYCMPIKLIAEMGLLITIIILYIVIKQSKRRGVDLFVVIMTLWLYVQFDSYAFYAFWILLYISKYYDRNVNNRKSYFLLLLNK